MIVLIDNYDSFTFNLFHYLGGLGADVVVHRNDKIAADDVIGADPDAIVLSPGPCTPNDAGICLDLIAKAAPTIPILGVCLGHQAIGQAFGGKVVRAPVPVHGKLSADQAPGRRRVSRHQCAVPGDALPFAGGRAREHAGRSCGQRRHRRPAGHGARACKASGPRRAVPSREHRVGAWPSHSQEFSRHRRGLECVDRPASAAPDAKPPARRNRGVRGA